MSETMVWLLILGVPGYNGPAAQVQPPYFSTAEDCARVGKSARELAGVDYRCVQVKVMAVAPQAPAQPVNRSK